MHLKISQGFLPLIYSSSIYLMSETESVMAQVVPKATFVEDVQTFVQGTALSQKNAPYAWYLTFCSL